MSEIPYGHCQCGCGQKTSLAPCNYKKKGLVKNEPVRFIRGHSSRLHHSPHWKGGRKIGTKGYIFVKYPNHPRANKTGYIQEHILVAEQKLGRPLNDAEVIHHINGNKGDNSLENIYICASVAEHADIERAIRAYKACGHADWRKCVICHEYDDPKNMTTYICGRHKRSSASYHKKCNAEVSLKRRRKANGTN